MRTQRPTVRAAAAVVAVVVVASAAWALLQAVAAPTSVERVRVEGTSPSAAIEVDQGDIEVRAVRGAKGVTAIAEVRGVVAPARTAAALDGEARLLWSCRLWTTCRADVRARVAAGVDLRVTTAFGDVRVTGPVGDLDLTTGSGGVQARRIQGAEATVRARSGDVTLAFARAPRAVDLDVSSGDITIEVPHGSYRITADARGGSVVVDGIRDDPGAKRHIAAETTGGDIRLDAR